MDEIREPAKQVSTGVNSARNSLIGVIIFIVATIIFGLLYLFVIAPQIPDGNVGWFLFSFATGLTMIVMPCTLPLAFVIVPLSMGKGMIRGLSMAVAFGLGIAVTLSLYGVAAALLGGLAVDALGADLEQIKNWVYFIAGTFALLFALSEIGLLNFHMPTYTGAAPAFIQKRQEILKAFFLGLFLGNVGVGCPHPATPLLLIEIATNGDLLYGWLLFLIHAIGRILPLLLLAFLAILGVNGLTWLMSRKSALEKATGWAMVFVAGFILTLGLFSHDWWVNSGLHSGLEVLTQESRITGIINNTLGTEVEHSHGLEVGEGLFGLPLEWGNWFLVLLWVIPIWWWYQKKKRALYSGESVSDESNLVTDDGVTKQQLVFAYEERILHTQRNYLIVVVISLVLIFTHFLPSNFYLKSISDIGHDDIDDHSETTMTHVEADKLTPFTSSISGLPSATGTLFVELDDGDRYAITASYVKKELGNHELRMLAYNDSVPGPFIKVKQGSTIIIDFTNNTDIDQTIHSHGLRLDNLFDGVPDVTQTAVKPGESFTYTVYFPDAGVAWYHPHTRDDYGQEMGLYGNYIILPEDQDYWSPVNREVPLIIDDIFIEDDKIANFYKDTVDHALLGRFGNTYLVNGEIDYNMNLQSGEVVRFLLTNVSNVRTYRLSIPGAKIKIVGSDWGRMEHEYFSEAFLISPAERVEVEVLFPQQGIYKLTNTTPNQQTVISEFVVSDKEVDTSYTEVFMTLRTNEDEKALFDQYREDFIEKAPDKEALLTVELKRAVDHSAHMHAEIPIAVDESKPHDHDASGTSMPMKHHVTGIEALQWDDPTHSDVVNTQENVEWQIVDRKTGKVSMDIDDWNFKMGELVKIRFTNSSMAMHVMQHPIHFHGQRFVVLSNNGVINQNMVWKDTVLVLPGEYIDVLVEMSNPGVWMSHCHISEHLHAGMMFPFRVEDENGDAPGDTFRAQQTSEQKKRRDSLSPTANEFTYEDSYSSEFTITTDVQKVPVNISALIALSFTDRSGFPINLDDTTQSPLKVTFVNSDNSVRFTTYPGNAMFPGMNDIKQNIPNTPGFDESKPHDHSYNFIQTVHAGGDHAGGHDEGPTGRTYSIPVKFPAMGEYKGFVEFIPKGETEVEIGVISISVTSGSLNISNLNMSKTTEWWVLLLTSFFLIFLLVSVVRKYINNTK